MNAVTETLAMPVEAHAARPFYWSVRRELWENRSLYIAPLIAAGVVFIGFLLQAMHLPHGMQILATLDPERQRAAISGIYGGIGVLIVLTMAVVTWFYTLDALYSERRDRSILFWKSLPVSDTTTVLSKLFTAMVVAPVIALAIVVSLQVLILLLSSVVVLIGGVNPAPLWSNLQLFQLTLAMLYALLVLSLWYAPVYAWLLLVSAWAKKSVFLWAVLPPVAIVLFEKIAFDTGYFARMLAYRLQDGFATAFIDRSRGPSALLNDNETHVNLGMNFPNHVLQLLDPAQFLSNPWLWVGLAVAAALVAAAVWMRRYREPI